MSQKNKVTLKEKELQRKAQEQLWREGILEWKLHPSQKDMYDFFHGKTDKTVVFNCSRRLGKTYLLLLMALEVCIKRKSIVKFILPEQGWARKIVHREVMPQLLDGCPKELVPTFKTQDNVYEFANGSQLQLAGTDNGNYEKLRGGNSDLCIIDEAGFCSDLNHIISSILIPTTLLTKGRIILSSTTPDNPNHEFVEQMRAAATEKRMIVKTLYDGLEDGKRAEVPHITPEIIEEIIKGIPGGVDSDAFRTEFLCQLISDSDKAVFPEFSRNEDNIVCEWHMPVFCDKYVAMDIGFKDLTVVLFGFYDFENAVLVVQDELVINGPEMTTQKLADLIKAKEDKLWTSKITGEKDKPFLRVCDNNLIVINDLASLHALYFSPTEKQNKDAAINKARMMLESNQIKINPRCHTLINHLKTATWAASKKDYIRVNGHHFDACFTEDAKVLTDKGYKLIKDIQIGDSVLTHKNRFKKVLSVMNKDYSGDLLQVKPNGREVITCTPEHQFYVFEKYRNTKGKFTGQTFLKEPEWKEAKDLTNKHFLYVPNLPNKKTIDLNNEMCFLYGYYVAEGSVGGNGYQISFAGHKKETKVMDILRYAIDNTYGFSTAGTSKNSKYRHKYGITKPRSSDIRFYLDPKDNGRKINVTQKNLRNKLKELGKSIHKKFPDFIMDLNREQSLYMLAGYIFGDGHFSPSGLKSNTISPFIRDGVEILYRKLGFIANIHTQDKKENNLQYWVNIDKQQTLKFMELLFEEEILEYCFQDKLIHPIYLKIKRHYKKNYRNFEILQLKDQKTKVYNLEVEDDNSYTVNGVAVHNCDSFTYLVRNLSELHNPFPKGYRIQQLGSPSSLHIREDITDYEDNKFLKTLDEQFKPKSSLPKRKKQS